MMLILVIALLVRLTVTISVVVLAYERPTELHSCLRALRWAHYPVGTSISLEIRIDRSHIGMVNDDVLCIAKSFKWPFGKKVITIHPEHVGLQQQWLTIIALDYTLVVEDDIILSPLYYFAIKAALQNVRPHTFGISLQRPQWQMGRNEHGRWRRLDLLHTLPSMFLFQGPSTWGFLLIPLRWGHFRRWAKIKMTREKRGWADGSITTKWIIERGEECLISPLMFEYMLEMGLYNQYFWPGNGTVLASARIAGRPITAYHDYILEDPEFIDNIQILERRSIHSFNPCFDLDQRDKRGPPLIVSNNLTTSIIMRTIQCHYKAGLYPDDYNR